MYYHLNYQMSFSEGILSSFVISSENQRTSERTSQPGTRNHFANYLMTKFSLILIWERKSYQQWKDLRCQDRRKMVEEYNLCWQTQWWRWARGWIRFISDNCWSNFIPITTSLLAPGGLLLHLSSTLNKTHWKQWLGLVLKNMRFFKSCSIGGLVIKNKTRKILQ